MTDNEIIKALECCAVDYCNDCPLANEDIEEIGCDVNILFVALDLINRLKAENEELNDIILTDRSEAIKLLKAEAIKEFAERLKGIYQGCKFEYIRSINARIINSRRFNEGIDYCIKALEDLVKEMVGEIE